jgi:hypothetical protein
VKELAEVDELGRSVRWTLAGVKDDSGNDGDGGGLSAFSLSYAGTFMFASESSSNPPSLPRRCRTSFHGKDLPA